MQNKISKAQSDFKIQLLNFIQPFGYHLVSEDENKKLTSILLSNGRVHIADFYVPELKLFIELSGNNYLPKLLKMTRAHNMSNINYVAFIEIRNKEMSLLSIPEQFKIFCDHIKQNKITEMCKVSSYQLDNLIDNFYQLCINSRKGQ